MGNGLLQRLRIFVASPNDVAAERDHVSAVVEELNRDIAPRAGLFLEAVRWETHVTPNMGRPQQVIFEQIGSVDIFIGIMWQRFGTPTGVAGSGAEEEFEQAYASWQQTGRPRMLCYFSRVPIEPPPNVSTADQLLKVARFCERLEAAGLNGAYTSVSEFKDKLRGHLQSVLLNEFAGRNPPLDRNLEALLEIEKLRCRERNIAFLTPNLLFALLNSPKGLARVIFDKACPDKAQAIVDRLRAYTPPTSALHTFSEFDWYSREDVQAARRRAIEEGKSAIDARYLLLGFLAIESETQKELKRALGKNAYNRLCRSVESAGQPPGLTPGLGDFFRA